MKNYDTQRIIARYLETPVSISKIAEEFDLCKITVSRLLKKANVPMWTRQDLNIGELKTDYFQKIDTEDKAYLLGLFAADGCVYTVNCSKFFTIQLKKEDAEMIRYIKNELNAPRKIVIVFVMQVVMILSLSQTLFTKMPNCISRGNTINILKLYHI